MKPNLTEIFGRICSSQALVDYNLRLRDRERLNKLLNDPNVFEIADRIPRIIEGGI